MLCSEILSVTFLIAVTKCLVSILRKERLKLVTVEKKCCPVWQGRNSRQQTLEAAAQIVPEAYLSASNRATRWGTHGPVSHSSHKRKVIVLHKR